MSAVPCSTSCQRTPPAQLRAGPGIARVEQQADASLGDLAAQRQQRRTDADPRSGRLALTGVVVLPALGDLLDVVATRRRPRRELADRQHLAPRSREARITH